MRIHDVTTKLVEIISRTGGASWVVGFDEENGSGELGFRIFGMNFWYYKWPDPMLNQDRKWRPVTKREFGEVIVSDKE